MYEFKEYCKISVHNHFGDSESERKIDDSFDKKISFNYIDAIAKIKEAYNKNFNLLAFTNANVLLVPQYLALKKYAQILNINLTPGTEVNIFNSNTNKILHLIILFNPKSNLINIAKKLENSIIENNQNYITIDQLVDIILCEKVILIPHGIKQTRYERGAADNPEQFKEIIAMRDAIPIIIEDNRKYHKETLKVRLKDELNKNEFAWLERTQNVSCADRGSFSNILDPTYIWGNNTFDDLYFAVLMQGSRIKRKDDIINKPNYISKIEIIPKNENSQIEKTTIICSHGLNSIIGKSGSGKTLLLNAIKKALSGKNLEAKVSGTSEYDDIYKDVYIKLYNEDEKEIDISSNWKVFEGDNLYNKILKVYSSDKTSIINELNLKINDDKFKKLIKDFSKNISNYVGYQLQMMEINKHLNNLISNFASNIKFLEDNSIVDRKNIEYFVDTKLESEMLSYIDKSNTCKKDLEQINFYVEKLKNYSEKYKIGDVENELSKILLGFNKTINIYMLKFHKLYLDLKLKCEKQKALYNIIKKYNSKLGKKIEEILIKKQENLNIIEKIKSLLEEYYIIKSKCILKPLCSDDFIDSLLLEKNNISKLKTNSVNLKIEYDKYTDVFSNCIGQANNKINVSKFRTLGYVDLTNCESLMKFLQIFINEKYVSNIELSTDYSSYIDCQVYLKNSLDEFENIETMSAGELSKTYISNMLEEQIMKSDANLIVLFDQPDNSLEKKFILDELAEKIDKLRNKFQVFITTHEPLLVVNADSNNIIKAENDKIAVNHNNHITYENLSFVGNANSKEKMIETIASLVDGSYDAVRERNKIYGGMLNENES